MLGLLTSRLRTFEFIWTALSLTLIGTGLVIVSRWRSDWSMQAAGWATIFLGVGMLFVLFVLFALCVADVGLCEAGVLASATLLGCCLHPAFGIRLYARASLAPDALPL